MGRGVGKYGVAPKEQRTSRDGIVFDSKGELGRYEKLRLWQLAGEIRNLQRQVRFDLIIPDHTGALTNIGFITLDFVYEQKDRTINGVKILGWSEVFEDFKGMMTKDASLRIRVFEARTGRKVLITKK